MIIHLPDGLERFIRTEVLHGRFASEEEAITEAVRLLRLSNTGASRADSTINKEAHDRGGIQATSGEHWPDEQPSYPS